MMLSNRREGDPIAQAYLDTARGNGAPRLLVRMKGILSSLNPREQLIAGDNPADRVGVSCHTVGEMRRKCNASVGFIVGFGGAMGVGGFAVLEIAIAPGRSAKHIGSLSSRPASDTRRPTPRTASSRLAACTPSPRRTLTCNPRYVSCNRLRMRRLSESPGPGAPKRPCSASSWLMGVKRPPSASPTHSGLPPRRLGRSYCWRRRREGESLPDAPALARRLAGCNRLTLHRDGGEVEAADHVATVPHRRATGRRLNLLARIA